MKRKREDKLLCAICKDPYEGWHEVAYCPTHKDATVHTDCTDRCYLIGCGSKRERWVVRPQNIVISEGIGKAVDGDAHVAPDDFEKQFRLRLRELAERARAAIGTLYHEREKVFGRFTLGCNDYAIAKGPVNFEESICIEVDAEPMLPDGYEMYSFVIFPQKRIEYGGRRWYGRKSRVNVYTGELTILIETIDLTFRSYEEFTTQLSNADPEDIGGCVDTLADICRLPRQIPRLRQKKFQARLNNIKQALEE